MDDVDLDLEKELTAAFEADWEEDEDREQEGQEDEGDDGTTPPAPNAQEAADVVGEPAGSAADLSNSSSNKRSAAGNGSKNSLGALPTEVWLRALSFLSAVDLTSTALVCRRMRDMCDEEFLWKRLYCHRWGAGKGGMKHKVWEQSWKASYMEKDQAEIIDILNEVPCTQMQDAFKQMQFALRQYSFSSSAVDDEQLNASSCSMPAQVHAWQASRGFGDRAAVKHRPDLSKRGQYKFHRIGVDTYGCEETGWVHLCGEACREKIVDRDSGLLVCPISGFTSDRMMTGWEWEEQDQHDEGVPQAAEDGAEEFGSRLARAFCEGYNCENEEELQWRCGVKLN